MSGSSWAGGTSSCNTKKTSGEPTRFEGVTFARKSKRNQPCDHLPTEIEGPVLGGHDLISDRIGSERQLSASLKRVGLVQQGRMTLFSMGIA